MYVLNTSRKCLYDSHRRKYILTEKEYQLLKCTCCDFVDYSDLEYISNKLGIGVIKNTLNKKYGLKFVRKKNKLKLVDDIKVEWE